MTNDELCAALVTEARRWVGTKELGDNGGQYVEWFQKAVDGKANGEPWCLAFVQFCVRGVDAFKGSRTLLAPTEHVLTCWRNTPATARISAPMPGCVVLWRKYLDTEATDQGHAGIVVRVDGSTMQVVEGNTGPCWGANIEREGDGVYEKTRRLSGPVGSMHLLGFLNPWPE